MMRVLKRDEGVMMFITVGIMLLIAYVITIYAGMTLIVDKSMPVLLRILGAIALPIAVIQGCIVALTMCGIRVWP